MTSITPDMVAHTTTSTGVGDLDLDGSVTAYRTIAQAIADGDYVAGQTVGYVVVNTDGREAGRAIIELSGATYVLRRAAGTVRSSTNGGARISAAGAGVTQVFLATAEADALTFDDLAEEGGTIPETDRVNRFTGKQEVYDAATNATGESFDALAFLANNAVAEVIEGITISLEWTDAADGNEDADLVVDAIRNGIRGEVMRVGGNGLALDGLATTGAGELNARAVKINGVPLTVTAATVAFGGTFSGADFGHPGKVNTGSVSGTAVVGRMAFTPVIIGQTITVTGVSVECAGTSFADDWRVGLYENTNGKPGARVHDFGRLTVGKVLEVDTAAISQSVTAGQYWIGAMCGKGAVKGFTSPEHTAKLSFGWRAAHGFLSDAVLALTAGTAYDTNAGINYVDVFMHPSGTKLFAVHGDNTVDSYDISPAWDISSISTTGPDATFTDATNTGLEAKGVFLNGDGTKMFLLDADFSNRHLREYALGTAYDLATASYTGTTGALPSMGTSAGNGLWMNSAGTRFIASDNTNGLRTYSLSVGFDVSSTVALVSTMNPSTTLGAASAQAGPFTLSSDGTKLFCSPGSYETVAELGTAADASTVTSYSTIGYQFFGSAIHYADARNEFIGATASDQFRTISYDPTKNYVAAGLPSSPPAVSESDSAIPDIWLTI